MVDGAIVLVDAAEGVLPQTKFVVGKALARGLHPIVVVNKVDRADARPDEVHTEVFDLFAALGATDAQLDFPMLYASGRQGWADATLDGPRKDLSALFDLVVQPRAGADGRPGRAVRAWSRRILEYDHLPRPRADRAGGAGPRAAQHAGEGAARRRHRRSRPAG